MHIRDSYHSLWSAIDRLNAFGVFSKECDGILCIPVLSFLALSHRHFCEAFNVEMWVGYAPRPGSVVGSIRLEPPSSVSSKCLVVEILARAEGCFQISVLLMFPLKSAMKWVCWLAIVVENVRLQRRGLVRWEPLNGTLYGLVPKNTEDEHMRLVTAGVIGAV